MNIATDCKTILDQAPVIIQAASYIIAGAAGLAALFPQAKDANSALGLIRKGIDLFALNVGNAKNAPPASVPPAAPAQSK